MLADLAHADIGRRGYARLTFADLPGWQWDDHRAAARAFLRSCAAAGRLTDPARVPAGADGRTRRLIRLCAEAKSAVAQSDPSAARVFFERNFTPYALRQGGSGHVTGYFEPVLEGSRRRSARFNVPIYRRPPDLVTKKARSRPRGWPAGLEAARRTSRGLVPYPTRAEIEAGALAGRGLELLYLDDPIDAFFLHIQGSGRVKLDTGETVRLGFAAKNGHPYTAIGRILVERGVMTRAQVTMQSLVAWLRANPKDGAALMARNRSFIFFVERAGKAARGGPIGADQSPLTAGRSLAVDPAYHRLGLPIYVVAPDLKTAPSGPSPQGFFRLMIAQDVGSAIKGPERGDIYWGSGKRAGAIAGRTDHAARFFKLVPKPR